MDDYSTAPTTAVLYGGLGLLSSPLEAQLQVGLSCIGLSVVCKCSTNDDARPLQEKGWNVATSEYDPEPSILADADFVVVSLVESTQQQVKDLCSTLQQASTHKKHSMCAAADALMAIFPHACILLAQACVQVCVMQHEMLHRQTHPTLDHTSSMHSCQHVSQHAHIHAQHRCSLNDTFCCRLVASSASLWVLAPA